MHIDIKEGVIATIEQLLVESNWLIDKSEYLNKYRGGVYSSVTLDGNSLQKMQRYLKGVGIEMMPLNKIHITVMYSKSRPSSEPKAFDINGTVEPKSFGIFGKGTSKEPYALVIEVSSPELEKAHRKLKKDHNLKATYPEYKPHISLTYDINRVLPGIKHLSKKQKETIINIFNKMLPELPKKIHIQKHEVEGLK